MVITQMLLYTFQTGFNKNNFALKTLKKRCCFSLSSYFTQLLLHKTCIKAQSFIEI